MPEIEPQYYEEWLRLTPKERVNRAANWDVYHGEGYLVAIRAAARLKQESLLNVIEAEPGLYHGGEWVIHAKVGGADIKDCPRMLEQEFEGFRVVWINADDDKEAQVRIEPLDSVGAATFVNLLKTLRVFIKPLEAESWVRRFNFNSEIECRAPAPFAVSINERGTSEKLPHDYYLGSAKLAVSGITYRYVMINQTNHCELVEQQPMQIYVRLYASRPALQIFEIHPRSEHFLLDDFSTPSIRGMANGLTF
jgi:hypothetical protein